MMDYELMAKLVLDRIRVEQPPKWKRILGAILKRVVIFLLLILILSVLFLIQQNGIGPGIPINE